MPRCNGSEGSLERRGSGGGHMENGIVSVIRDIIGISMW
jgi:hypothetical protein